jgi:hypothetical protein
MLLRRSTKHLIQEIFDSLSKDTDTFESGVKSLRVGIWGYDIFNRLIKLLWLMFNPPPCFYTVGFLQMMFVWFLTPYTCLLMEQSPSWEANQFSASQEIPRILWNPKFYYHIHKCPPPVPNLSQLNPVHTTTSRLLKTHLNIILPSRSGSPEHPILIHPQPTFLPQCQRPSFTLIQYAIWRKLFLTFQVNVFSLSGWWLNWFE